MKKRFPSHTFCVDATPVETWFSVPFTLSSPAGPDPASLYRNVEAYSGSRPPAYRDRRNDREKMSS